jgi:cytidylate kinase
MVAPSVIGVAGRVGSGKSSLATLLGEQSGWAVVRFSDYLKHLAGVRGIVPDRESLQRLGVECIDAGWDQFCTAVLEFAGWRPGDSVIVEGIRHAEAVGALNAVVAPGRFFLVYLAADDVVIQARIRVRDGARVELQKIESHPSDGGVGERLHAVTDVVLDANRPLPALATEVWRWHGVRTRYRTEMPRWIKRGEAPAGVSDVIATTA